MLAKVQQIRAQCAGRPFVDREFGGLSGVGDTKYNAAPEWARMCEMSSSPKVIESETVSPDRLTRESRATAAAAAAHLAWARL